MTSIDNDILALDKAFFEQVAHFDEQFYFYPINFDQEKERFFRALTQRQSYNPVFEYPELTDKDFEMKQYLENLTIPDHEFGKLYIQIKRRFLLTLEMAQNRQAQHLTQLAQKKYGIPSSELVQKAQTILQKHRRETIEDAYFGTDAVIEQIKEKLVSENITGWTIEQTQGYIWLAQANHVEKKIYIPSGLLINQHWIDQMIHQTLEIAVYQYQNALLQPLKIFQIGLDRFEETKLGMVIELAHRNTTIDNQTLRRHAGGVLSSYLGYQHSFWDTYKQLSNLFSPETAFTLSAQGKLGLTHTSDPGGMLHTHLPLQGWKKIQKLTMNQLYLLYVGLVGIDQIELLNTWMEEEKIVQPRWLPSILQHINA